MRKFRIVKENGRYYVEQSVLVFFWRRLVDFSEELRHEFYGGMIIPAYKELSFSTEKEAEDHIRTLMK